MEYSAASDAYTHAPEGFNEFFQQRRRWVPSTMANIFDLLMDYKSVVKINDNISMPYIGYQTMLIVGTIIGKYLIQPGLKKVHFKTKHDIFLTFM